MLAPPLAQGLQRGDQLRTRQGQGILLLAGAAGTAVGIWWAPIGIAATACFVLYFLGAVVAHLRVKDWPGAGVTTGLTLVSAAALVLRLLSL